MKQEDFFRIMDCASEDDIADMMRYHRSRRVPDREEEIVMTKYTERAESESRHGKGIAAAVAAVLVCANIAGGAYLLNSGKQPGAQSEISVGTSIQSELIPAASENTPDYVKLMQEYFTDAGGQPCTFDFTGYGKDFDIQWENDDYKLTFRAVAGCEWALYYFYDVEPKKGQTWEQMVKDNPHFQMQITSGAEHWSESKYKMGETSWDMMGQDKALDNGVWHFCTLLEIRPDAPLYQDDSCLNFSLDVKYSMTEGEVHCTDAAALDFFTHQHPMQKLETPIRIADLCGEKSLNAKTCDLTLTKFAATPFGVFYCGESVESVGDDGFSEWPYTQKAGETLADYVPSEQYRHAVDNDMIAVQSNAGSSYVGVRQQTAFMNLLFKSPVLLKNAKASAPENIQEIKEVSAETPQYVQLMQEYYTNLNGQPCTYDFTGLGQDYNLVYEFPDYTLTLKSMVGCDWVVYYFYDIKPQGTSETGYNAWYNNHLNAGDLIMFKDGIINFNSRIQDRTSLNNEQSYEVNGDVMRDYALEDGVWHMVDRIINNSDKPFFSGENSGMLVTLENVQYLKDGQKVEPFTFETQEFPLHETAAPEITGDLPADTDKFVQETAEERLTKYRKWTSEHPLTRCAETPFGTFYVSNTYTDGIEHGHSENIPMESLTINGRRFTKGSQAYFCERGGAVMKEEPRGNVSLFDAVTQP